MSINNRNHGKPAHTLNQKCPAVTVKNTAPDNCIVWRLPEEDFHINANLTVMQGEEALFVKGDRIGQVFESGTYTLSAQKYSFICRLRNLSTGGMNAFNCIVYFIKKTKSATIPWRTLSPIQVRDRGVGLLTDLYARGTLKFEIEKPKKFLNSLLENKVSDINSWDAMEKYFTEEFQGKIKASITRAINQTEIELLGLEKQLNEFSYVVQVYFSEAVKDYGLKVISFSIDALDNDEI